MTAMIGTMLCLAYVLGLLLTRLPGSVFGLPVGAIALLITGVVASVGLPKLWRTGPKSRWWLVAGLIGLIAAIWFEVQLPKPGQQDISFSIPNSEAIASQLVFTVQGQIDSPPRLTRSDKIQFWLKANNASATTEKGARAIGEKRVTGRVYVTVPLLMGTGLHPKQAVTVTGSLYRPKPASNPGGFDFQAYLKRQGGFAGLNGQQIDVPGEAPWGLWAVRQRIVRSQVRWLGVPEGPLLSAMVMGKNSVDVPYAIRDQFANVGLSHALAASGFQVSLLIGVLLKLTQRLSPNLRLGIGSSVLVLYIGLTGVEASVLRAGVMGFAVLLAATLERKVKPMGSLLCAATLLLLYNPIWIWDLGFQLSFLATIGLLVTTPVLMRWLDWLPPTIATLIAVPVAAYLWTLPLQLHVFGIVSPYSIPVNIITALLLTLISIGGMISAVGALITPVIGSGLSLALYYPTHLLVKIVEFCSQLPGHSFAIGTISVGQTVLLYGLICLVWWRSLWWRYWWIAGALAICLIAAPVAYASTQLLQITVLAGDPVLVIRDQGKVGLINSGDESNASFAVVPFLKQQGVNQLDWAIATPQPSSNSTGWSTVGENFPIQAFYDAGDRTSSNQNPLEAAPAVSQTNALLPPGGNSSLSLRAAKVMRIGDSSALQIELPEQRWLILPDLDPAEQQVLTTHLLQPVQTVWWFGQAPIPELLAVVKPNVAIASSSLINSQTADWLKQNSVELYQTRQDGAVQWTPQHGFTTLSSGVGE
jgi:competence protein ComEC